MKQGKFFEDWITVLIPTYNRRGCLLNTLKRLEQQTNKEFYVYIVDNNSNYDINELFNTLPFNFVERCTLKKREVNIGGSNNCLYGLAESKTKWVWNISDDDDVRIDAIETIYKYIRLIPNAGCINFTLAYKMPFDAKGICACDSLKDLIDLYYPSVKWKKSSWHGDLIFMSNKVYNMDVVRPVLPFAIHYAYCEFPSTLVILGVLKKGGSYFCINKRVVDYNETNPRSWDAYKTVLATRILKDIDFGLDEKLKNKLLACIGFSNRMTYNLYFSCRNSTHNQKDFFEILYFNLYKYILPIHKRIGMRTVSVICKTNFGYALVRVIMRIRFSNAVQGSLNFLKKLIKRLVNYE